MQCSVAGTQKLSTSIDRKQEARTLGTTVADQKDGEYSFKLVTSEISKKSCPGDEGTNRRYEELMNEVERTFLGREDVLKLCWQMDATRVASDEELLQGRVHTNAFIAAMKQRTLACADANYRHSNEYRTQTDDLSAGWTQDTELAARTGVASLIDTAYEVLHGNYRQGFVLAKPPSHHAVGNEDLARHESKRNLPFGFCHLNSIASAVANLRATFDPTMRIAILDFDVHPGNGNEDTFWNDPNTLTISIHQDGIWPGPNVGRAEHVGGPGAVGSNMNVPMPAGSGDKEYCEAMVATIFPKMKSFEPTIVFVAAGFDALDKDPYARQCLSHDWYGWCVAELMQFDVPLVLNLEGGYDPCSVAKAINKVVDALAGAKSSDFNIEALAFLQDADAATVTKLLAHENEDVRAAAANKLLEVDEVGLTEADSVASLLVHSNAAVRELALDTLAEFGSVSAKHVDTMVCLVSDSEAQVRAAAALALVKIGKLQTCEQLASVVSQLLNDREASVRGTAAEALAEMGEAGASHAKHVAKLVHDEESHVRGSAIKALARMDSAGSSYQEVVAGCLSDSSAYVSKHAARALAQMSGGRNVKGDVARELKVQTDWSRLLDSTPPTSHVQQLGNHEVWLVDGLFSARECAALLAAAEGHGFGATTYDKEYRGNLRLIATDSSLAEVLWSRLRRFVPQELCLHGYGDNTWNACGLNECFRLSKYHPHDRFGKHVDAKFIRNYDEMSMYTVNVYMNEGFKGGSTRFYMSDDEDTADFVVTPKTGLCLLFRQPVGQHYTHDGEEVGSGLKYLLRSDLMYRRG